MGRRIHASAKQVPLEWQIVRQLGLIEQNERIIELLGPTPAEKK